MKLANRITLVLAASVTLSCSTPATPLGTRQLLPAPDTMFDSALISRETVLEEIALPGRTIPSGPDLNPPLAIVPLDGRHAGLVAVEVEMGDMDRGQLRLDWAIPESGEPCGLALPARHARPLADGLRLFRFDLTDSPCWSTSVDRFVLATGQSHRARVVPRTLRLLSHVLAPERLAGTSFAVTIGDELRSAAVVAPGTPWTGSVSIESGDVLDLGIGVKGVGREQVVVYLRARGRGEDAVDLGRLECADETCRSRWRDYQVDLAPLEPGDWTLEFSTETPEGTTVFVANPTVRDPSARTPASRPNVILVVIDTLRADHLSAYGYPLMTSPSIDRWARKSGVLFEQAVAAAPTTLPSHTSMFTGLEALRHGANHDPVPPSVTLLAEQLRAQGYTTAAATGGGFLHPRYGLFQGFDRYRYFLAGHLREDELLSNFPHTLEWMENLPQPFFVLLHTYEVHGPYRPRQPYLGRLHPEHAGGALVWLDAEQPVEEQGFRVRRRGRYQPSQDGDKTGEYVGPGPAIANYDSSIAYVDQYFGQLVNRLEALGLERSTTVILTSDHGEAFGEHDHAGHGYLFDNNLLVPLIVAPAAAGRPRVAPRRVGQQVRVLDLAPTILEIAGISLPTEIDGVSLLGLLRGDTATHPEEALTWAANTNHGLSLRLGGRAKATFVDSVWPPYHGLTTLHRIDRDPQELEDIAMQDPAALQRALDLIRGRLDTAAGTHLELHTSRDLTVRARGAAIGGTTTKSLDQCGCFRSAPGGGLDIQLRAGDKIRLLLEGPPRGDLELAIVGSTSAALHIDTRLLGSDAFSFRCDSGGCSTGSAPRELEGRAWRVGPTPATTDPPADAELVQQLRALGYLH